jgi:hypothetical protein
MLHRIASKVRCMPQKQSFYKANVYYLEKMQDCILKKWTTKMIMNIVIVDIYVRYNYIHKSNIK